MEKVAILFVRINCFYLNDYLGLPLVPVVTWYYRRLMYRSMSIWIFQCKTTSGSFFPFRTAQTLWYFCIFYFWDFSIRVWPSYKIYSLAISNIRHVFEPIECVIQILKCIKWIQLKSSFRWLLILICVYLWKWVVFFFIVAETTPFISVGKINDTIIHSASICFSSWRKNLSTESKC